MKEIIWSVIIVISVFCSGILVGFLFEKEKIVIEKVYYETIKEIKITPQYEVFEITAYTAGYESTGKNPGDDWYAITASGEPAIEGRTIACPKSIPFGTPVFIPMFENVFYCTDRGSAITEGKLDIYMENLEQALQFGRRDLEVFVLP